MKAADLDVMTMTDLQAQAEALAQRINLEHITQDIDEPYQIDLEAVAADILAVLAAAYVAGQAAGHTGHES